VAIGTGHLVEAPVGAARVAAADSLFDRLGANRQAALADRDDQLVGGPVVAHCLPVVTAFRARAAVDPLSDLVLEDVAPVARFAGRRIDAIPHVLERRL